MAKAADLNKCVPQRAGAEDCVVAALATITHMSYEKMTAILGLAIDPAKGCAIVPKGGVDLMGTIFPLLELGWVASPLVARERGVGVPFFLPTRDQIKTVLPGRIAVVSYKDADPIVGDHALAWDGHEAIDCSDCTIVSLDDISIDMAVILTKIV